MSIVEFGGGTSTIFLAHAVARNGGHILSIEHDPEFADYLVRLIARNDLQSVARVEVVPIEPLPADLLMASPDWRLPETWYAVDVVRKLCPPNIDVLVVDGPPALGLTDVLIRDPAVAVLAGSLAPSYSVFLDDVDRPADRATAERWERQLGIDVNLIERIALAVGTSDDGLILTL